MARPHPVVRLATKLAHTRRGSSHHAHVAVHLIINKVEFIACIEGQSLRHDARLTVEVTLGKLFLCYLAQEGRGHCRGLVHFAGFDFLVHQVGDVHDAVHEAEFQSRRGQLFCTAHGPETIRQVVMLHAAVLLDGGISAVVVGQNQTFGRNDFARASAAEDTHGILQRYAIGIVEIVSLQLETLFLHQFDGILLLQQLEQPHAFVGAMRAAKAATKYFFTFINRFLDNYLVLVNCLPSSSPALPKNSRTLVTPLPGRGSVTPKAWKCHSQGVGVSLPGIGSVAPRDWKRRSRNGGVKHPRRNDCAKIRKPPENTFLPAPFIRIINTFAAVYS